MVAPAMTGVQARDGTHHEFPCQSCGAKLQFTPGAQALQCPYCGASQEIAGADGAVEERSLHDALQALAQRPVSELAAGGHEIECSGCGAVTVITGQASACPFCDSPVVVPIEEDRATIVPESVLPFAVDEREAGASFKEWMSSRWFAPNDLAKRAERAKLDGVYLPYYTFDSHTHTDYSGERGVHYYETETYEDAEGNTQTREVQKTRWYPAHGHVQLFFDDLLVCASKSLPTKLIDELEPWDLEQLQPFDPGFLSGFMAERAAVELVDGFEVAAKKMEPDIDRAVRGDIGGDTQRVHHKSTAYSEQTFKLFLLPLWLSSFRYKDKVYRFVVNARTGETAGERPWSAWKISLAVLGGLAVIAAIVAIVMLTQR